MNWLIRLAWRNVFRNRRRSILAFISVCVATASIVALQGYRVGLMASMIRNYTRTDTGHVRITSSAFAERSRFMPVTDNLADPGAILKAIRETPGVGEEVVVATERIRFGTLLNNDGKTRTALAVAGDPAVEKDLMMLAHALEPGGHYLEAERELIMGKRLADALNYKLNDTVKVMTQGADAALHLRKFKLVGIFNTGIINLDERLFQIGLSDARQLLRMGDSSQQIIVMLQDPDDAPRAADLIRAHLADASLSVLPWTEIGDIYRLAKVTAISYSMINFLVSLMGAFVIGNIMMMVVMERRHEIGILRSMGFQRRQVLWLFLLEGMFLGGIGSVAGLVAGSLLTLYYSVVGIDFGDVMSVGELPMDNIVYFGWNPGAIVVAFVLGVVVAALLSLLPAYRASRLKVIEAIRIV